MEQTKKKYQVFVSSTYSDLIEERKEVIQALLELDCIPSGMELFPATDDDQWSLIKSVIDECDYYIVIIAGRYGSISSEGIGYTEMEYQYALQTNKPIIAFLHKNPGTIPQNQSENGDEGKEKLTAFRKLAEEKHCKYWTNASDLGSMVSRSLIKLQKTHPSIGWVRGNSLPAEAALQIIKLKDEIDSYKSIIEKYNNYQPEGIEVYASGDDSFTLHYIITTEIFDSYNESLLTTWDRIFRVISPHIKSNSDKKEIKDHLTRFIWRSDEKKLEKYYSPTDLFSPPTISIDVQDFQTIIIQFSVLGLISIEKNDIWKLSPYGEKVMIQLWAIKKDANKELSSEKANL